MAVYNNIDPFEDESHQIISSYFLGPKAENYKVFKKCLVEILEAQRDARLDYFPKDGVCALPPDRNPNRRAGTNSEGTEIHHREHSSVSSISSIYKKDDQCCTTGIIPAWQA